MFVYGLAKHVQSSVTVIEPAMDLQGKIVLITGSTSGIGLHAAKAYFSRGATVIVTCRDVVRGKNAIEEIQRLCENPESAGRLHLFELDLCSYKSILAFAREILTNFDRIDVLVCNAGVMGRPFELTTDGIETHFATNQFGHFVVVTQLLPLLTNSEGGGRIMVVSSGLYKGASSLPHLRQLMGESLWDYDCGKAYAISKLANCLFTVELAKRLSVRAPSVSVYSIRPGFIKGTELGRETHWALRTVATPLIWMFAKNLDQGIVSIVHCGTVPVSELKSGSMYYMGKEEAYLSSVSEEASRKLWDMCCHMEDLIIKRDGRLTDKDKEQYKKGREIV